MFKEITEGKLSFIFNSDDVTKYDDWSFYRNRTDAFGGLKAVDIIYLNDNKLWLIEVKDYRGNPRAKKISLLEEISFKVRDTLCGLVCAKINANDDNERNFANKCLKAKEILIVLHLEQSAVCSRLHSSRIDLANLKLKLSPLKKIVGKVIITSKDKMHQSIEWDVKEEEK